MAWRCWFLTARPSQRGHVIAEKCTRHTGCFPHRSQGVKELKAIAEEYQKK
jgi:hypothetical protein